MATTDEVLELIIEPMSRLFGKPYGCRDDKEVAAAKAEYVASLRDYPPEALESGWAAVRSKWAKTVWPPIAVITEAVAKFQREMVASSGGVPADRTRRFSAAIEYVADGTAPPPGLGLPLKQLIAARVSALTKRGLPLGQREAVPFTEAEAIARRVLSEAA